MGTPFSRLLLTVILLLAFAGGIVAQTAPDFAALYQGILDQTGKLDDATRLHQLFVAAWDQSMHDSPESATYRGYPGLNHLWSDRSPEAYQRGRGLTGLKMQVLSSIDRAALTAEDQLNYDLFERQLTDAIDGQKFHREYMAINQMGGPQQGLAGTINDMPATTVAEYEDILARLAGIPTVIAQTIELMREGLEAGITPPRVTLRDVPDQVTNQISSDPAQAALMRPVAEFPESIAPNEQERIRNQAYSTYADNIVPAFEELHVFLVDTYLPACRESIAWSDMPDGEAWYSYLVKHYVTMDLTPEEIFETGLSEVARLRAEMDVVIKAAEFKGDYADWCEHLRTDPKFFHTDPDELVREYRDIAKRADPELVKLFGHLPRLPYGVIKIPDYAAKSQTTAYYQPGSSQAERPGYYYVNTYDLSSRPRWEMEPLSLHEAVPGHHLQISIAQELEDLPKFRKHSWFTAYGEGWALYSESLGEQMGFYDTPYSKYGQLSYQMWRAVRLVVDVGMHSKGWSRQQAIDYFMENSCKVAHDVTVEIDRYIVWPGQALAYKLGELKILELRDYAISELGEHFDLRAFHDKVLGHGTMPMDLLESMIKHWVASQK